MAAKKRQNKMVHFKGSAFSVQVLGLLYVNYKAGGGRGRGRPARVPYPFVHSSHFLIFIE